MDNKRLFSVMLIGLGLMLGWLYLVQYLDTKNPEWNLLNRPPATQPATTQPATAVPPALPVPGVTTPAAVPSVGSPAPAQGSAPGTSPAVPSMGSGLTARGADAPATVTLGSVTPDDPTYRMGLELTSRGGGVQSVTLNRYKRTVEQSERYVYQTPSALQGMADVSRVLATRQIVLDGVPISLQSLDFKLVASDATSATFSADLVRGDATVARVSKTYRVTPTTDAGLGYEIRLDVRIENLSQAPVTAVATLNGTSAPPWEIERGPERMIVHGYANVSSRQVFYRHTPVENFTVEAPNIDVTRDRNEPHPLSWFGTAGAYFNAIIRPEPFETAAGAAPATTNPATPTPAVPATANYLARVDATNLNPAQKDSHLRDFITTFTTTPLAVQPGQAVTIPLRIYLGPKQRAILEQPYYAAFPLNYHETLVTTTWLCSFCTFQWLIGVLVAMLNFFHGIVRDWGVAIILLVAVVRILLHPITRKAQENMAKMSKMAPEMERIKKKYGDDKEGLNRAMMEFYKEQGATPVMGCLPMFLQMPIWIALYAGLQSTFELRHQPFLYGLTWINDLAKPDHLITFQQSFVLCGIVPVSGLNIIPFLLAVVFFLQFHFQPKPPTQTPEQEQQMKIMKWMTLIMPVFLYGAPSGLNIYILTSTTIGIIENKLIRDAIKRREALQADGKVESDDAPVTNSKKIKSTVTNASKTEKKKGVLGWIEDMQNRAEEIRRQQGKK